MSGNHKCEHELPCAQREEGFPGRGILQKVGVGLSWCSWRTAALYAQIPWCLGGDVGEEADGLQAGRQGTGVESVFYTRRDSIQPRPCPYLSTYWLLGFRQITLDLSFFFYANEDNFAYFEELQYEAFVKHCPPEVFTPFSSPHPTWNT